MGLSMNFDVDTQHIISNLVPCLQISTNVVDMFCIANDAFQCLSSFNVHL